MGFLRLLLALSVVIDHTSSIFGYVLIGPRMAVQSFFIISGFYMALIINEKYAFLKHSYKLFLTNRFLRIYPIYWLVLCATTIFVFLTTKSFPNTQPQPWLLTLIKNIFLFPSLDYLLYIPKIYGGLYVFQAWTLGLELQFYFVAPFLVKRNIKILILLIMAAIASRIYFTHPIRFYQPNLIDSFIPTEILFFLLGIFSYKIYSKINKFVINKIFYLFSWLFFISFTLFYQYISVYMSALNTLFPRTLEWIFYLALVINLPFMFIYSQKSKLDKFIGDLSFPTYIIHTLLISVFVYFGFLKTNNIHKSILILLILFAAVLLNKFVAIPLEIYRQKRIKTVNKTPR